MYLYVMIISGIYKIKSKVMPERVYIGSAININLRWRKHLNDLKSNKHHSIKLQNHYNKYGKGDLQFLVLSGCDKEDLIKHEQYFIDSYNPYFNICVTAYSHLGMKRSLETIEKIKKINLGRKASEEAKYKMSMAHKGKKVSLETKKKMSEARKGRINSEETRKKISLAKIGKPRSEETKRKDSEVKKGKYVGMNNPFYGKKHSIESRIKISKMQMGCKKHITPHSEKTKQKIRESLKGRKISDSAKENRRIGLINKKLKLVS